MKNPEEIFYVFTKNSNPHSLYLWLDHNEFSKTFHQDLYKLCYDGKNVFLKNHYYDYAEFIQTTFKNFQKLSKPFSKG